MTRQYEDTHPWITFSMLFDPPRGFWRLLGEAESKCDHLERVPLRDDVAQKLSQLYLAKGALATTAIEGNTLTEAQPLQQVQGQLSVEPSREYQRLQLRNIIAACDEIEHVLLRHGPHPITPTLIKEFNGDVLADLAVTEDMHPGDYRTHSVTATAAPHGSWSSPSSRAAASRPRWRTCSATTTT